MPFLSSDFITIDLGQLDPQNQKTVIREAVTFHLWSLKFQGTNVSAQLKSTGPEGVNQTLCWTLLNNLPKALGVSADWKLASIRPTCKKGHERSPNKLLPC